MTLAYQNKLDIINRALQRLGVQRMATLSDHHVGIEILYNYDKIRRAELRRNLWVFATRTMVLRALDTTSQFITFPSYASGTTYNYNNVVTYNNEIWTSLIPANVGNLPGVAVTSSREAWGKYFGPMYANAWNDSIQNTSTTNNTSYYVGEMAYDIDTGLLYASLSDSNQNDPTAVDDWSATTMYDADAVVNVDDVNYQSTGDLNFGNDPTDQDAAWWATPIASIPTYSAGTTYTIGQAVVSSAVDYYSLTDGNVGNTPASSPNSWASFTPASAVSGSWSKITSATLATRRITYPVTAGPASDISSRNAYYLPAGFLRKAPQAPKAGALSWLAAHNGLPYSDWIVEGDYITANANSTSLIIRFIMDATDVATFDDMFCEGLSARLAWEAAPILAPDSGGACRRAYNDLMSEARIVDAIETGPIEQDEDEYITCRL